MLIDKLKSDVKEYKEKRKKILLDNEKKAIGKLLIRCKEAARKGYVCLKHEICCFVSGEYCVVGEEIGSVQNIMSALGKEGLKVTHRTTDGSDFSDLLISWEE